MRRWTRDERGPDSAATLATRPPICPFTACASATTALPRTRHRAALKDVEESLPISVVGTGPDLDAATECGLRRAARLLGMSVAEVRNRATITGAIEIGRLPGVVQVTFLAPVQALERAGLLRFARERYGEG